MDILSIFLIGLFFMIVISWVSMMIAMKKTTGEIKHFVTPNNLVKMLAIIIISLGVIILVYKEVMPAESGGTILAGIIGYTLGSSFEKKEI